MPRGRPHCAEIIPFQIKRNLAEQQRLEQRLYNQEIENFTADGEKVITPPFDNKVSEENEETTPILLNTDAKVESISDEEIHVKSPLSDEKTPPVNDEVGNDALEIKYFLDNTIPKTTSTSINDLQKEIIPKSPSKKTKFVSEDGKTIKKDIDTFIISNILNSSANPKVSLQIPKILLPPSQRYFTPSTLKCQRNDDDDEDDGDVDVIDKRMHKMIKTMIAQIALGELHDDLAEDIPILVLPSKLQKSYDIIGVAKTQKELGWSWGKLSIRFNTKDMGEIEQVLGMRVSRGLKNRTIYLDQEQYFRTVLDKFGFKVSTANRKCHPSSDYSDYAPSTDQDIRIEANQYQQVIGSLMFAMILTRPEISHALGKLSQHMSDPCERFGSALKKLMRCLNSKITQ
ncbi:hypothetical protein K3495_g12245 [Podosphaera aphanis]|nr:hypothetical protein K3495_g12245 [Podosphaera aphanis]